MKRLEDLIDAHLDGHPDEVPVGLGTDYGRAIVALDAIREALDETILNADSTTDHAPRDHEDRPPPILPDDYAIARELGRGGMGVVYLARQKSLGRDVAVKVLRVGETAASQAVRRFLDEARHLARLRHPHIVAVHEIGRAGVCCDGTGGEPYFTMDYVDGEPLTALIAREKALSPTRAVALIRQAAEAVRHAHAQGLIHRDLKPGNILVDRDGKACVTDFGLARELAGSSGLTRTGELMGTPAYMAPEQVLGQADRIGEATDVHALGAVLFELLTGRPPFGADTPARVLARILDVEPTPPRRLDRRVPRDLETIVLTALAKDPSRRYPTAAALLEDLRRFEDGLPPLARRPGPLVRSWRFARRHWRTPAVAVVLAAALLGLWALILPAIVPEGTPASMPDAGDAGVASLLAVGDEHAAAGNHALAARFYAAALNRADETERTEVLGRLGESIPRIDDPAAALEIALPVVELAPELPLGRYDHLIARTLVTRGRDIGNGSTLDDRTNRYIADVSPEDRPKLQVAEARLDAFLKGRQGSEAERTEFERALAEIREKLSGAPRQLGGGLDGYPERVLAWEEVLSRKPLEELARDFADGEAHPLDRAKIGLVLGGMQEAAGDFESALATDRAAYELARSVFPFFHEVPESGVDDPWATYDRLRGDPSGHLGLLPRLVAAIRRLDPLAPDPLTGSVTLRFEGVEIPDGVEPTFRLRLHDAALDRDEQRKFLYWSRPLAYGFDTQPARDVTFRNGRQTVTVGVAEGMYSVVLGAAYNYVIENGDDAPRRFMSLIQVDVPHAGLPGAWPEPLEVVGTSPVELPPIRARLMEEIVLASPSAEAPVDLRDVFFRWNPLAGAHHYDLSFVVNLDGVDTGLNGPRKLGASAFCFGVPHPDDAQGSLARLRRFLTPGTLAEWSVLAYDEGGALIGKSRDPRPFVVAHGVDDGGGEDSRE